MKLINFFHNSIDYWVIGLLLVIALVFFIRDFKLTSIRSWLLLFGLFAVGAIAIFKSKRNKRLLEELAKREKELNILEEKYEQQEKEHAISRKNYERAKKELGEMKKKTAIDILKADEKYAEDASKLEKQIKEASPEDMIQEVNKYLSK